MRAAAAALLLAGLAAAGPAASHEGHDAGPAASAYGERDASASVREPAPAAAPAGLVPRYEPPPPSSYELPPIRRVARHALLDASGARAPLGPAPPGEVSFVSFVYLSCTQACPLATATLVELDRMLAAREELRPRVELVTVSFDPVRDTPEAMARLRDAVAPKGRWRFLTAEDPAEVPSLLEDFGQDAVLLRGPDGELSGELRHVLKIFLVDDAGAVRNIYSTGLLDPRLLVNDALTVLDDRVSGTGAGTPSGAP